MATVMEKIIAGDYKVKIPYPERKTSFRKSSSEELDAYIGQKKVWQKEEQRLYDLFRVDALEEARLTEHPRADKAFDFAWSEGHSSGFSKVFNYLLRIAEVLVD